jgi:hypothetical protein
MVSKRLRMWFVAMGLMTAVPRIAAAQLTMDQSASIVVFPKVIADGTWETIIQLASVANTTTHARCFYVDGASPSQATDFDLWLTLLQPTHWLVSAGRPIDPQDPRCDAAMSDCNGAGFDPGNVPAAPANFRGELLCVELDAAGTPVIGNHLSGVATLTQRESGAVAKYNAIGVPGNSAVPSSGGTLSLDGSMYSACPQTWMFSHLADGAEDPLAGPGSTVTTTLTIVPCAQNFETRTPAHVTVQFRVTNEFEQMFSASTSATGWADVPLSAISSVFEPATLGSDLAQTRIAGNTSGGIMVVAQQFRRSADAEAAQASMMVNMHLDGARTEPDLIVIPVSAQ